MRTLIKPIWICGALALTFALTGCGKKTLSTTGTDANLQQVLQTLQATKEPYRGNLTPERAALINFEIAQSNLAEFQPGKELPKDPKEITAINDRLQKKNAEIYAKNGTSQNEMMRYLSDLTLKDRESYNQKLTDLFLASNKKRFASEPSVKVATPQEIDETVKQNNAKNPKPAPRTGKGAKGTK